MPLSASEICVLNAERLLEDATRVSPPTSAALAELSIEEAANGWMLYFRILFQGRKTRFKVHLSPRKKRAIDRYLEKNPPYLSNLDSEIQDAFRHHKVKLRFLTFLLGYVKCALPLMASERKSLVALAKEVHGPAFNVRETDQPPDLSGVFQLIKAFRLERLPELDSVKQRGFYVRFTKSGDLTSPSIEPFPNALALHWIDCD